jgi:hypothetical protein
LLAALDEEKIVSLRPIAQRVEMMGTQTCALLLCAGHYIIDSNLRKKYKGKVPKTLEKRVSAG